VSSHEAFWIDQDYDREQTRDGNSRYAEQIRRHLGDFAATWGDISPVGFACVAWRLATAPALTPGYVRWHRRVLDATCLASPWDGTLSARVTLVSPWPNALTSSRTWWHDRGWRDWPETFGQFLQPADQELAKNAHLRASLLAEAPIPFDELPAAPEGPDADIAELARRAVIVLTRELNDLLAPVVQRLDGVAPSRRRPPADG
jgi:hypothetical protein